MTSTAKRFCLVLALIAAITLGACLIAGPALLASYAEQKLISMANRGPVSVSMRGLEAGLRAAQVKQLRLFYPRYMSGFDLDQVRIEPDWAGLTGLSLPLRFSGSAYGGSLKGTLNLPVLLGKTGGELTIRNIDLASHPQIQGLGIVAGKLSADLSKVSLERGHLPHGALAIEITGLSVPRATVLPSELAGQSILIPRITDLSLSIVLQLKGGNLTISNLVSASQFGAVNGSGTIGFGPDNKASDYDLRFEVRPTSEGAALLTLLSTQLGDSVVTVKGKARPRIEFKPLAK